MPPIIPDRLREEERTDHKSKHRSNAAVAQWAGDDFSAMQQCARDRVLPIVPVCGGDLDYGYAVNTPVADGGWGSDRGTAFRASGKQCVS
ncbi:hypothetical protein FIU86_22135 (plasmid) [Roseovarius sp. THAF9]|nr:hypothetical protein FIU86_22135 [Roseovarius sp. THAF9]